MHTSSNFASNNKLFTQKKWRQRVEFLFWIHSGCSLTTRTGYEKNGFKNHFVPKKVFLYNLRYLYFGGFCLVSFGVFIPFEKFSLGWRRRHYRWRATMFYLCSALLVIQVWWFLNVPYLLWHGPTLYNGHFLLPMTLRHFVKHLVMELSLHVITTWVSTGDTCYNDLGPDRGYNPELLHARWTLYHFTPQRRWDIYKRLPLRKEILNADKSARQKSNLYNTCSLESL